MFNYFILFLILGWFGGSFGYHGDDGVTKKKNFNIYLFFTQFLKKKRTILMEKMELENPF